MALCYWPRLPSKHPTSNRYHYDVRLTLTERSWRLFNVKRLADRALACRRRLTAIVGQAVECFSMPTHFEKLCRSQLQIRTGICSQDHIASTPRTHLLALTLAKYVTSLRQNVLLRRRVFTPAFNFEFDIFITFDKFMYDITFWLYYPPFPYRS